MATGKEIKKVLIFDDDRDYRNLVKTYLAKNLPGAEIIEYDPVAKGAPREDFDWSGYDVMVLDYYLCIYGITGLDILQKNRKKPGFPATIMLTGAGDEEVAVRALDIGVYEYLRKEKLTKEVLIESVNNAYQKHNNDVIKQEEQGRINNAFDKALFYKQLEHPVDATVTSKQRVLLLISVDNLDVLATEFGLLVRDNLLRHIAGQSYEKFRITDNPSVTRLGDSSVGVLIDFPGTLESLESSIHELCEHLGRNSYIFAGKAVPSITSIGALVLDHEGKSISFLVNLAGQARDIARQTPGNSWHIFTLTESLEREEKHKREEQQRQAGLERKHQEEERLRQEEKKRKEEEERLHQAEIEKQHKEEEARIKAEQERLRQQELKQKAEEERLRHEAELERQRQEEEKRKLEEEQKRLDAERQRLEAEKRRQAEEEKKRLEQQRLREAEEKRKEVERQKLEEERRKLEEERQKLEEQKLKLEVEEKKRKEEQRQHEAEEKRKEEERQKLEMERQKLEAERRQFEDQKRKLEEEEKKRIEKQRQHEADDKRKKAERRKLEEEQRRLELERQRLDAEKKRQAEEEKRHIEEQRQREAEQKRREEERQKLEAERRRLETERQRLEEEKRRQAREEEKQRLAEEERKRKEEQDQLHQLELEKQRREEESRHKAEKERLRIAEQEQQRQEEQRRVQEKKRKAEEDERQRQAELERQRQEEQISKPKHKESGVDISSFPLDVDSSEQDEPETSTVAEDADLDENSKTLKKAFDDNRILQTFQPVVAMFTPGPKDVSAIFKVDIELVELDGSVKSAQEINRQNTALSLQQSIDHWMLREIIGQVVNSDDFRAGKMYLMAISEAWLTDITLFTWLKELLTGVESIKPGKHIALELPVSMLITHKRRAMALIRALKKSHGFRIALGDIKTLEELNSLAGMLEFNLLTLKRNIMEELRNQSGENDTADFLKAIKNQGARIIMDGVEDSTMLTDAISSGADYVMGGFIGEAENHLTGTGNVESFHIS